MDGNGWQQLGDERLSRWNSGSKHGSDGEVAIEMEDSAHAGSPRPHGSATGATDAATSAAAAVSDATVDAEGRPDGARPPGEYRVYKRRWFGLVQLTLLNIIVSWDVSWLLPVSLS